MTLLRKIFLWVIPCFTFVIGLIMPAAWAESSFNRFELRNYLVQASREVPNTSHSGCADHMIDTMSQQIKTQQRRKHCPMTQEERLRLRQDIVNEGTGLYGSKFLPTSVGNR